jgi:hypothetical protein
VKFVVVDPHLYEQIKDHGGLILAWDAAELADRAHPRRRRLEPFRRRRRLRLATDLFRALEHMKRDLIPL